MYVLSAADIGEEGDGELKEIDAWLFDDSQNAKDAASVGVDFTATLRKNMGIRLKAHGRRQQCGITLLFKGRQRYRYGLCQRRCSISSRRLKTSTRTT